ncbi:hypothetical protein AXF42_Ash018386 [Apostasia shenzhenica]|uniref:Pentatricopeptide repeat-containing protein n=1 Tax=Apostasia shenzhenica TaxID=1088818 RepID=A0A2I0BE66_9ASPA|nr:hypothetical protein AXF42_Ash018386 [Apostasia shenzhenica]
MIRSHFISLFLSRRSFCSSSGFLHSEVVSLVKFCPNSNNLRQVHAWIIARGLQIFSSGLQPDKFTFPFALKNCAGLNDLHRSRILHQQSICLRLPRPISSWKLL